MIAVAFISSALASLSMSTEINLELVERIEKFERGEMTEEETVEFFQHLADTGIVWELQGTYQRYLRDFVEAGLVKIAKPFNQMNDENWKRKYLKQKSEPAEDANDQ